MSATQLTVNTIRYGSDVFEFQDKSVAEATIPWYIHDMDKITGFTITSNLPSGTDIRFLFKVASKEALNMSEYSLYKLDPSTRKLTAITTGTTIASVMTYGNTVAELNAMTDIPDFLNKKVLPVIGLSTDTTGKNIPSVQFTLNAEETVNHTRWEAESGIATFGKTVTIKRCSPEYNNTGGGTTEVKASVRNNGVWCAWKSLVDIRENTGDAIRFKYIYNVQVIKSTDQASVNRVRVYYQE